MEKLLIVDDSKEIRQQLKWGLGKEYHVLLAGDADEALALFRSQHPSVVTLDLGLPPEENGAGEGLRCLEEMLRLRPAAKVVIISGNEERENALRAVGLGAYDFYQKPIDLAELKVILARSVHLTVLEEENQRLQAALAAKRPEMAGIYGQCLQMQEVFATIRKVAASDLPVLTLGESGTGKELVARAIHGQSLRREGPFIALNCGAIPENLLESELFGHEKGAFTGAQARVQGKVEYADQGTLFLDEIGELPPPLQVKLLRFLQEKTIQRVGGRQDITVNARIIAATNVDIRQAIAEGAFREDLYYRIGAVIITLPPLRQRGDDAVLLANLFLRRSSIELKRRVRGFSKSALDLIRSHDWPGNIRELENSVKRAVVMADSSIIEPKDLGFGEPEREQTGSGFEGLSLREARNRLERDLVVQAIEKQGGNIVKAAEMLGVSRPTLYDLTKKHGLNGG